MSYYFEFFDISMLLKMHCHTLHGERWLFLFSCRYSLNPYAISEFFFKLLSLNFVENVFWFLLFLTFCWWFLAHRSCSFLFSHCPCDPCPTSPCWDHCHPIHHTTGFYYFFFVFFSCVCKFAQFLFMQFISFLCLNSPFGTLTQVWDEL